MVAVERTKTLPRPSNTRYWSVAYSIAAFVDRERNDFPSVRLRDELTRWLARDATQHAANPKRITASSSYGRLMTQRRGIHQVTLQAAGVQDYIGPARGRPGCQYEWTVVLFARPGYPHPDVVPPHPAHGFALTGAPLNLVDSSVHSLPLLP